MDEMLGSISDKLNRPYGSILWQYISEDFLWRIGQAGLLSSLWVSDADYLNALIDKDETKLKLLLVVKKAVEKPLLPEILSPVSDVNWTGEETEDGFSLKAGIGEHEVDFYVSLRRISFEDTQIPKKKEFVALNPKHKTVEVNTYSPESALAAGLFEILKLLELIGDMSSYGKCYRILGESSISGRHIVEELKLYCDREPKVKNLRRIDQIKGYRSYAYMRKRWNAYVKREGIAASWEECLERLMNFLEPVWTAICNGEVFFDDWMPELGRFLG